MKKKEIDQIVAAGVANGATEEAMYTALLFGNLAAYTKPTIPLTEKAYESQKKYGYFRVADMLPNVYSAKEYAEVAKHIQNSAEIRPVDLSDRGIYGYTYVFVAPPVVPTYKDPHMGATGWD